MFSGQSFAQESVKNMQDYINMRKGKRRSLDYSNQKNLFENLTPEKSNKTTARNVSVMEYDQINGNSIKTTRPDFQADLKQKNMIFNDYESDKKLEIEDQAEKLQYSVQTKKDELNTFLDGSSIESYALSSSNYEKPTINKEYFDKFYRNETKKIQHNLLESQLFEKQERKRLENIEKEKEKVKLQETIKKYNEDQLSAHKKYYEKIQEYKQQLDLLKSNKRDNLESEFSTVITHKTIEFSPENLIVSPNVGYISSTSRYTRKSPTNLIYNPITGVLKEVDPDLVLRNKQIIDQDHIQNSQYGKNNQKSSNIFSVKTVDTSFEEKNKNLIGYGNLIMQNK
jgi:hypothetical protein